MPWWSSLIILASTLAITAFVINALLTGNDVPANLATLLGTVLGLALSRNALDKLRKDRSDDE